MRYPTVFQPCQIGSLTLKNRLAMSQMTMNYATEEGMVTDKVIAYYTGKGEGGSRPDFRGGDLLHAGRQGVCPADRSCLAGACRGVEAADGRRPRAEKRYPDLSPDPSRRRKGLLEGHRDSTGGPISRSALSGGGNAAGLDARRDRRPDSGARRGGRPGQGGGIRRRGYPLRPRLSRPVLLLPDDESQDRRVWRGPDRPDPFSSGDHPGDSTTTGKRVSSDDQDQRG